MSEVYKITNMLVTYEDIKHIDKNWQSIIDEYTKTLVREKDLVIAQYLMKKQKEEIERLNNIINELEKYLNEQVDYMTHHSIERMVAFDCCRHRLQELKGSEKE